MKKVALKHCFHYFSERQTIYKLSEIQDYFSSQLIIILIAYIDRCHGIKSGDMQF